MQKVRIVIRTTFSLIILLLTVEFILRIFAPGTADTAAFFQAIAPLRRVSTEALANVISWPAYLLLSFLASVLPPMLKPFIPIAPVAPLIMKVVFFLQSLPNAMTMPVIKDLDKVDWQILMPGSFDWRLLLIMPLLSAIERLLLAWARHAEKLGKKRVRAEKEQAMADYFADRSAEKAISPLQDPGKDMLFRKMVTDLKEEITNLQGAVNLDPLTHLFNRGFFNERLVREMNKARAERKYLSLIMIDIDDFKRLNDTYGHPVGDKVLVQVALILSQLSPPQGKSIACRYGGEELALILTDTPPEAANRLAETIREQITQIKIPEQPKVQVSASIGLYTALFIPTNGSFELTDSSFVAKADSQMYIAKRSGKNRVVASFLP